MKTKLAALALSAASLTGIGGGLALASAPAASAAVPKVYMNVYLHNSATYDSLADCNKNHNGVIARIHSAGSGDNLISERGSCHVTGSRYYAPFPWAKITEYGYGRVVYANWYKIWNTDIQLTCAPKAHC